MAERLARKSSGGLPGSWGKPQQSASTPSLVAEQAEEQRRQAAAPSRGLRSHSPWRTDPRCR